MTPRLETFDKILPMTASDKEATFFRKEGSDTQQISADSCILLERLMVELGS